MEESGWTPVILTVKDGSYPATDQQLLEEVADHWPVYQTKTIEPISLFQRLIGRAGAPTSVGMDPKGSKQSWVQRKITMLGLYVRANMFIPDARMGWRRYAIREAKEIIHTHDIQAIVTTGPPHSVHLIALALKSSSPIPWLADFRDPWTSAYYNANLKRSTAAKRKDLALETAVLTSASAVTCVSPAMAREFDDRNDHVQVVYNGYDPSDFASKQKDDVTDHFTLAYIGTIKNLEIQPALWKAIASLRKQDATFRKEFRLEFTGNVSESVKESIANYGLAECTHYLGFAEHSVAIQRMKSATALLFIIADLPGSDKIVTGKIFEYLASGTPIFGIGPADGGADMVLKDVSAKSLMPYDDQALYEERLMSLFTDWRSGSTDSSRPDEKAVISYSRQAQAAQIAKILNELSK